MSKPLVFNTTSLSSLAVPGASDIEEGASATTESLRNRDSEYMSTNTCQEAPVVHLKFSDKKHRGIPKLKLKYQSTIKVHIRTTTHPNSRKGSYPRIPLGLYLQSSISAIKSEVLEESRFVESWSSRTSRVHCTGKLTGRQNMSKYML
jgi:hypothetical protein